MNYYNYESYEVLTKLKLDEPYKKVDALNHDDTAYYLYEDDHFEAMGVHLLEDQAFMDDHKESLKGKLSPYKGKKIIAVNLAKVDFPLDLSQPKKKRVHVLGLGDVGGIMLSGLRMLGGNAIESIGLFDLDDNKIKRWCYELNQIMTIDRGPFPPVYGVDQDKMFDCDVFIFTASSRIPEVGSGVKDVRMFQLEANTKIISIYAKMAKEAGFKGQFVVVSDPVDLLCKAVLTHSGLRPEQVKGFGLGVMHARACYYAEANNMDYYIDQGRAFGPHGQHLVIADSMARYDEEKSLKLTEMTVKANLDVRAVGYKPFIAPALSSAALSILAYLEGKAHYSTVYIDGVYFGCKHKVSDLILVETEKYDLAEDLVSRLEHTYKELSTFEF